MALTLGAIELHLRRRREATFVLGALAGLGRPAVWALVGSYAGYLWWRERRWWPLVVGVPVVVALWVVPDWIGSGDPLPPRRGGALSPSSVTPRYLAGGPARAQE